MVPCSRRQPSDVPRIDGCRVEVTPVAEANIDTTSAVTLGVDCKPEGPLSQPLRERESLFFSLGIGPGLSWPPSGRSWSFDDMETRPGSRSQGLVSPAGSSGSGPHAVLVRDRFFGWFLCLS